MTMKFKVLVAGRSEQALQDLTDRLAPSRRLHIARRHIVNGHADPLYGITERPDLLVLHIADGATAELEALLERPSGSRPPLLVVADTEDSTVMRLAMNAGARDYLLRSQLPQVVESVAGIADELNAVSKSRGELIGVVNAKGGSGATFLACNLAHITAVTDAPTALVGLDIQFPTLPSYFDLQVRHGLLGAIDSIDSLDDVALDAMMETHDSGLRLLAGKPQDFRFSFDSIAEPASRLFDLLIANHSHVFVDVPRRIDELSAQILSKTDRIVMVVQQSLPHVQDATRLQQLLRDQLGIPAEQLVIVVNRFSKNAEVQVDDIVNALPDTRVVTVPNQFKVVSESINIGVPVYDHARGAAVTKALIAIQSKLCRRGSAESAPRGFSSLLTKSPLQQLFGGH